MLKPVTTSHFRNPLFIFMFYLLMVLPHFAILCHIDLSDVFVWSSIETCTNAFVVDSFLQNSIWSLLLVTLIFETLHWHSSSSETNYTVPSISGRFVRQTKLAILLLAPFALWQLLSLAFEFLAGSIGEEFVREGAFRSLFKVEFFGLLAWNLNDYLKRRHLSKNPWAQKIQVSRQTGLCTISVGDILWVEKIGKKYFAFSTEERFELRQNLKEMEEVLPDQLFKRINRSSIVNISSIDSFSFWENEKYILVLKNKKEFVVTRRRVVQLKKTLKKQNKTPYLLQKSLSI